MNAAAVHAARRKTDVSNLLESAGFSKSNPYYIVQQGKVRAPSWTAAARKRSSNRQ